MIHTLLLLPEKLFEKIVNTKVAQTILANPILTTVALITITVFWSFPSYDIVILRDDMQGNWSTIFLQAKEPFLHHNYAEGSHAEKLAFRFVPAIILSILHIDRIIPALLFQFFTLMLFYYLLVRLFNEWFVDGKKTFLYALPICFVISGHVYASDYRGFFDTLAIDFLLIALLLRNNIYVIIPLLLAYFTDERALIASPAVFLINIFFADTYNSFQSICKEAFRLHNLYLVGSWILYFCIRATLHFTLGLTSGSANDCFLFLDQISRTFYTLYVGLEGFLIPFVLVIFYLIKNKNYTYTLLMVLSFSLVFFIAQSVLDINRSMSYDALIIILILLLFDRIYSKEIVFKIILWIVIINMLYDDFYPFLAQLYRMKFITHTI